MSKFSLQIQNIVGIFAFYVHSLSILRNRNKKSENKGSSGSSFNSDIIIEVYRGADAENVMPKQ